MKRILYIEGCRDRTIGGSHMSLYSMLSNFDRNKLEPIVILYEDSYVADKIRSLNIETHIFPNEKPVNAAIFIKNGSFPMNMAAGLFCLMQKPVNFSWYFLRPVLSNARFIKKNNIDIVHINNSLNTNHDWMLAAKLAGIKIVAHQRGFINKSSRTAKFFGTKLDTIICISNTIASDLLTLGLSKEKVITIYNGIDLSNFRSNMSKESLRNLYSIDTKAPVIGVVGNIKQWKGQEIVVRATAILQKKYPAIKCLFVGSNYEEDPYYTNMKKMIEDFGIKKNVIFTGFKDNIPDFFNIMDVVVHSSIEPEPFGRVNIEAMYMKKPVVSTNIGGPTEIFTNGKDGILINPGNPELLAQTLSFLLDNKKVRLSMGENAYETVIRNFSITNTVRQVEECYEKICQ